MLDYAAWAAAASLQQPAPTAPPPAPAPSAQPAPAPPSAPPDPAQEPEVGGVTVTAPRAAPPWASKLNLDPRGDFAKGALPYYERPLQNGCRLALTIRCKKTFW